MSLAPNKFRITILGYNDEGDSYKARIEDDKTFRITRDIDAIAIGRIFSTFSIFDMIGKSYTITCEEGVSHA